MNVTCTEEIWPTESENCTEGAANWTTNGNCTVNEWDNSVRIAFNATWLLISVVTIAGNGLIIDIYRRVKKARTSSNFCLILLAVSDLTFGAGIPIMVALYFIVKLNGQTGGYIQIAFYSLFLFSGTASTMGLLSITYDRFLAIVWPLHYVTTMPLRRKIFLSLLVLPPSVIFGFIVPLTWHNTFEVQDCHFDWDLLAALKLEYFRYILIPVFILCNVLKIGMYTVIFTKAIKFSRRKTRLSRITRMENNTTNVTAFKGELKVLKSGLLIFGLYYLCVLPFAIIVGLQVYKPGAREDATLIYIRGFFSLPVTLNSAINPIIYCFRVKVFKDELKKLFSKGQKDTFKIVYSSRTGSQVVSASTDGLVIP